MKEKKVDTSRDTKLLGLRESLKQCFCVTCVFMPLSSDVRGRSVCGWRYSSPRVNCCAVPQCILHSGCDARDVGQEDNLSFPKKFAPASGHSPTWGKNTMELSNVRQSVVPGVFCYGVLLLWFIAGFGCFHAWFRDLCILRHDW